MVVSPTYLFTYDGRKVSSFHADALKKIKAFDRAAAVSQQLRMWEWLLTRPPNMLDADGSPAPFHLGPLVEVSIDVRPLRLHGRVPRKILGRSTTTAATMSRRPMGRGFCSPAAKGLN